MAFYDLANNINQALEAGLEVIVKEALANGRLTRRNQAPGRSAATLAALSRIAAEFGGTSGGGGVDDVDVDAVALAVAMAQPFRPMVLSGAATQEQMRQGPGRTRCKCSPTLVC